MTNTKDKYAELFRALEAADARTYSALNDFALLDLFAACKKGIPQLLSDLDAANEEIERLQAEKLTPDEIRLRILNRKSIPNPPTDKEQGTNEQT